MTFTTTTFPFKKPERLELPLSHTVEYLTDTELYQMSYLTSFYIRFIKRDDSREKGNKLVSCLSYPLLLRRYGKL